MFIERSPIRIFKKVVETTFQLAKGLITILMGIYAFQIEEFTFKSITIHATQAKLVSIIVIIIGTTLIYFDIKSLKKKSEPVN